MVRKPNRRPFSFVEIIRSGRAPNITARSGNRRTYPVIGRCQIIIRYRLQPSGFLLRKAQFLKHCLDQRSGISGRIRKNVSRHTAHNHRPVKQSVSFRRLHQAAYLHTAARLPEDGHIVRISSKRLYVVPDPLKGCHQIRLARIGGTRISFPVGRQIEIAQDIQSVVHGDNHHIPVSAHIFPVIRLLFDGASHGKCPAVYPEHHRFFRTPVQRLTPDV